jgi:Ca-activated chloride channel family protein
MNRVVGGFVVSFFAVAGLAACGGSYHHAYQADMATGHYLGAPAPFPTVAQDRETYAPIESNPVTSVAERPVSTFSVDVDTAAYANVRRFIENGAAPPTDAVRVEELINYFSYDYPVPDSPDRPFAVTTELAPTPWNAKTHLLHIGLKGYELPRRERPPANLVFLIDVSGSMDSDDKLPLVVRSLKMLTRELGPKDRVAIVVYAGSTGVVLEPTSGRKKTKIKAALDSLRAGGSTAGGEGIQLAYALAEENFDPEHANRVILATDGDFNVGVTDPGRLEDLIARKRESGISLSILGFGTGNYNDALMERLSNAGNGNAAYIDNLMEARKVLVEEINATLFTIAKDVKIQVEFNPTQVAEYRLIGYENRLLRRQDFTDDKVDAGDIGAGHSVTAIYEIALVGSGGERLPKLRYQSPAADSARGEELAYLKLRYKLPDSDSSQPMDHVIRRSDVADSLAASSSDFRFAAAVAAFGQLLRGGELMGRFSMQDVIALARDGRGDDPWGYRSEFLQLARLVEDTDS